MCPVMTGGQKATKKAAPVDERILEFCPQTDSRSEIIIDDGPGHFRCTNTELLAMNREHADTNAVVSVWGQCKSRDPVILELVGDIIDGAGFNAEDEVLENFSAAQLAKCFAPGAVSGGILHHQF